MKLVALLGVLLLPGLAAEEIAPAPDQLSYQEFDQTMHAGWRALADQKQYREASALIEAYLDKREGLDRFQRSNLHWHAAQLLAFAGDTTAALKHIPLARHDPELPIAPISWNDYVTATEAFLQHDRAKLLAARDRMVGSKPKDPNIPFVNSLIAHFDEPYQKAYKSE